MNRTDLHAEVLTANLEHELHIPADTRRIVFSSPSSFPIRVSFVTGDVAGDPLAGFLIENTDTERIGRFDGPLYFASTQPHAILDVTCWSSNELVLTAPTGGGFSAGFGAGFNIGQ